MAQIQYQGYARDRGFKPVQVSTASIGRIAEQGSSLVRQMQENRSTERQNREEYLAGLRNAQGLEQQNRARNFELSNQFRENYQRNVLQNTGIEIQNAENAARYRELDPQVQALAGLADLSKTVGKMVMDWKQRKDEAEQLDEYVRTRIEGPDPQDQLAREAGKEHVRKVDEQVQGTADKLQDSGAPPEVVRTVRKLSPARQLGRAKAIAEMAVEDYPGYLQDAYANDQDTQIQYVNPDTGEVQVITPTTAIGPDQKAAVNGVLFKKYIKERGLLSISPAFWAEGLKTMKAAENKLLDDERTAFLKAENEQELAETLYQLDKGLDTDPVTAANEAMRQLRHVSDENGVRLSPLKAFQTVVNHLVNAGNRTALEALAESESYMKGVSWGDARQAEFKEAFRKIDSQWAEDEALQDRIFDEEKKNWSDPIVDELIATEGGADQATVEAIIEQSRSLWNGWVDPRIEQYATNLTLQARDAEEQKADLELLAQRGELTLEELDSGKYSWRLRQDSALRKAAEAGSRTAEAEAKGYRDQYKKGIIDALMLNAGMQGFSDRRNIPTIHFAEAHALKQLDVKAAALLQSGKAINTMEAYSMAAQELIEEIKNDGKPGPNGKPNTGTYSFSRENGEFRRWGASGSGASGLTEEAKQRVSLIISKIANGGIAAITGEKLLTIEQARALDNPDGPIPEIIQIMANSLAKDKSMTAFDIIDAQRALHGLPPRQRHYVQRQVESTLTPRMMELLNRTPTGMRTRRALMGGGMVGPGQDRQAVNFIAQSLGVDPVDVATFINYETGGNLASGDYRSGLDRWGGSGGKYLGWIQFSPENQQKYGVRPGMNAMEMAQAVVSYLKDSGIQPGDSIEMMYQAVQSPALLRQARAEGRNIGRDTNASISTHIQRMQREHRKVAQEWLAAGAPASPYRDPRVMSPAARRMMGRMGGQSRFFRDSPGQQQLAAMGRTPYVNQRASTTGPERECFSAVGTMVANFYGKNLDLSTYNKLRSKHGDSTNWGAQTAALRELGLNARIESNGSVDEVAKLAKSGKPVAIGLNHNGASGHWILVTGVDNKGNLIVNDPYGRLVQRRNGGWEKVNSGKANDRTGQGVVYNREFIRSIFEDRGPGTGAIMRIS